MERVGTFREIVDRMMEGKPLRRDGFSHADGSRECRPVFDKRPGDLEATRGLSSKPIYVAGSREANATDWRVCCLQDGRIVTTLTPADARRLAQDLFDMADVIECTKP